MQVQGLPGLQNQFNIYCTLKYCLTVEQKWSYKDAQSLVPGFWSIKIQKICWRPQALRLLNVVLFRNRVFSRAWWCCNYLILGSGLLPHLGTFSSSIKHTHTIIQKKMKLFEMEMIKWPSAYQHLMLSQLRCQDVASARHWWSIVRKLQEYREGMRAYLSKTG